MSKKACCKFSQFWCLWPMIASVHVAYIISQVQHTHGTFLLKVHATSDCKSKSHTIQSNCWIFLSSVFWLVHMVDALATKSCMNMQVFYFQLMSYPKEMKFIIPSNANNMGCDSVAMVTTNLAWKFVTHVCPWDLCCLLCSLYQAASRQTPMSAHSSKTNKLRSKKVKLWRAHE